MTESFQNFLFSDPNARKKWEELARQSLKGLELEKVLNLSTLEGVDYKGFYSQAKRGLEFYHFPQKFVSSRIYDSGIASSEQLLEDQKEGSQEGVLMAAGTSWKKDFPGGVRVRFILQKASEDFLQEFENLQNIFVDTNKLEFSKFGQETQRIQKKDFGFAVNVSQIHNAGASAAQELSFGLNVFSRLLKEGVKPEKIIFFVANDSLFFLNIAKLRALRFLAEEILSAHNKEPKVFILSTSSLREQTLYDPWVNMLRNCASSLAALLGGADQCAIRTHDSLFSLLTGESPSFQARRSARNILNIIREESRLDFVKDAGKGSFAIEELSRELAEQSWESFLNWEEKDLLANIKDFAASVEAMAKARREKARKRKKVITGVNDFANPQETIERLYQKTWRPVELTHGLFPLRRNAYEFEELRLSLEKSGKQLKACLIYHGKLSRLSARINFVKNIFEILGIEIIEASEAGLEQGVEFAKKNGCQILLFCGLDKEYGEWLKPVDRNLFKHQYVAGNKENFDFPGKDAFVDLYSGKNIYADLKNMLLEEGVL